MNIQPLRRRRFIKLIEYGEYIKRWYWFLRSQVFFLVCMNKCIFLCNSYSFECLFGLSYILSNESRASWAQVSSSLCFKHVSTYLLIYKVLYSKVLNTWFTLFYPDYIPIKILVIYIQKNSLHLSIYYILQVVYPSPLIQRFL